MKILYIEDDKKLAKLVCLLLQSHGYDVDHCARAQHGLDMFCLGLTTWNAVIVDLELPDGSGRLLISEMAAKRPGLPIIVHSGLNGPKFGLDSRFELFSSGVSAFVWKPSGGQPLLDVLKEVTRTPSTPSTLSAK
jgi:two-component system response regulator TctD